ncbi:hypothetical protein [Acetivibrio cellulolyticus]|uniref:hypothetical protein n=1 Tax=Acetivibrio cellulolyticus TaxID=35830 RepID=UPI0001E2F668|nr:hypothetical protein [Acetivibrio cellulolyticus]
MTNYKDFEATIVKKALEDPEFKKKLISDPKDTVEALAKELYGDQAFALPSDLKIKVIEETPDTYYIRIPAINPTDPREPIVGCW